MYKATAKKRSIPDKRRHRQLKTAYCVSLLAIVVAAVIVCTRSVDSEPEKTSVVALSPTYSAMFEEETTIHPQEPVATPTPEPEPAFTDDEITAAAQTVWGEARGIESQMEQAAVVWCFLNRVDSSGFDDTLGEVVKASSQFAYSPENGTVDDYGRDLKELVLDVVDRWEREKAGEQNVGRVLPKGYLWFGGENGHNWFRDDFDSFDNLWGWTLPDPYKEVTA